MYNTKFECRYHRDDVFLATDCVTENDINFIRNYLYKEDLLNIFCIDFGEKLFDNLISELYEKIKDCSILKEIMKKASLIIFSNNLEEGLCILYSYDYMYITHKCVSEYLDTGNISQENINLLKEIFE